MTYLSARLDAYRHPSRLLAGVRSLLMLAVSYRTVGPAPTEPGQGRVSCYAWSARDYHDILHGKLRQLGQFARQLWSGVQVRGVVDTAPLLEREFAGLAGLGWIGKNTMLMNREAGSWLFLAALLLDQDLDFDRSCSEQHCGNCTACLDACPTRALSQPYVLDATRCISYLTIELQGPIPRDLRPMIGDHVFGCDVCQAVCPWNRRAERSASDTFLPIAELNPLSLAELFELDDAAFRARFRGTPLLRARRRGLLRNAAIVLGNRPTSDHLPALTRGLGDHEPLVRGAAAWALGRLGTSAAHAALRDRLACEADPVVRSEISSSLCRPAPPQTPMSSSHG